MVKEGGKGGQGGGFFLVKRVKIKKRQFKSSGNGCSKSGECSLPKERREKPATVRMEVQKCLGG